MIPQRCIHRTNHCKTLINQGGEVAGEKPSQEFHLTPRGWISGTCREFGVIQGNPVDRPEDAIETWLEEMVLSYLQCADVYSWNLIWSHPFMPEMERKKVRERFPKPSDEFPG
jgi:hypothetical protein